MVGRVEVVKQVRDLYAENGQAYLLEGEGSSWRE